MRLLSEIFRNSRERRRECLYYLALGNYKLGNYAEARRYNELLLELEPANLQAGSLKGLIDEKVAKEGLVGAAIVGGIVVAAGVVGSLLLRGGPRRNWTGTVLASPWHAQCRLDHVSGQVRNHVDEYMHRRLAVFYTFAWDAIIYGNYCKPREN